MSLKEKLETLADEYARTVVVYSTDGPTVEDWHNRANDIRTALSLLEEARNRIGHDLSVPEYGRAVGGGNIPIGFLTCADAPDCLRCRLDKELGTSEVSHRGHPLSQEG